MRKYRALVRLDRLVLSLASRIPAVVAQDIVIALGAVRLEVGDVRKLGARRDSLDALPLDIRLT